jgi:hypothetical protein
VYDVAMFCTDVLEFLKNDVKYLTLGTHSEFLLLLQFLERLVKDPCGPTAAFDLLKIIQPKLTSLQLSSVQRLKEEYLLNDRIEFQYWY